MIKGVKKQFKSIKYLIYYPENYDFNHKYPLFFHLHGAGSRGENFENFEGSTILRLLDEGNTPLSQAICVFPQCHTDTWFDIFNELLELLENIIDTEAVDKENVTGSGVSMGGYGIYQVMMSKPECFTKAIVCCGGGMYWNSGRIKHIKFRIFHGKQDTAVYPEEAIRMYNRLREACADVSLTIYDDCDHNCWDKTYSNIDNLEFVINKN